MQSIKIEEDSMNIPSIVKTLLKYAVARLH